MISLNFDSLMRTWKQASFLAMVLTVGVVGADSQEMGPENLLIGGLGGIFLLPEPGELVVEIYKRDLAEEQVPGHLQVILVGPDRRPLEEGLLYGEETVRLSTRVEAPGVYSVNVTALNDRYGQHIAWGFRTNCQRYLIETSRGHKDRRHVEPIVMASPGTPQDVCFLPHPRAIGIEVSGLSQGDQPPVLFNGEDDKLAELKVSAEGVAEWTIPPGKREPMSPWRLHLPGGQGTVQIDGLTRWEDKDRFNDLPLWSPRAESFFAFHDLRWMLTPYSRSFYLKPGGMRTIPFRVHNNGAESDTFTLSPQDGNMEVSLSDTVVVLDPGESKTIHATVSIQEDAGEGGLRTARLVVQSARHPSYVTWSSLDARVGEEPAFKLDLPIVYRPYQHENEQFGYLPDYPDDNQIYFGPDNTPFIRADESVFRFADHKWQETVMVNGRAYRSLTTKVAFGGDGAVCLLGRSGDIDAYLYSIDGGETFTATPIPGREGGHRWDIENFTGHNIPAGPAPFIRATQTSDLDPAHFWRRVNDLELFLPVAKGDRVEIGKPIPVSNRAIGISSHSGIPSAIASRGDRVHLIWGEATDPEEDVPGVPAYVATWDRNEKRFLGEPVCVGYGPPPNDVHNTPSLVIDSEGFLHTLTGTHGSPFAYAQSLVANSAHEGFTEPELVEEDLNATYVGLVCGTDDDLHLVFRLWREDGAYHPGSFYANLAYKRKPAGQGWEPARLLAVSPFSHYSIFYHRLTIDRRGRLFVSFDYWSTYWFYRTDHAPARMHKGDRRKTILSSDGGESWKLMLNADLPDSRRGQR